MEWKEIEYGREYYLCDKDTNFSCTIRKMSGMNSWTVASGNSSLFGTRMIDVDSPEEAMWQATLMIYDSCNRIANYYHKIRDHLPSIHDLARSAGI